MSLEGVGPREGRSRAASGGHVEGPNRTTRTRARTRARIITCGHREATESRTHTFDNLVARSRDERLKSPAFWAGARFATLFGVRRPPRRRFSLATIAWLGALSLGIVTSAGCETGSSPTLPIPPPSALSSPPDADGIVTVSGGAAIEGALISVFNERTEQGVIGVADDMGQFSVRLAADVGDALAVWQRVGTRGGEILTVVVPRE